MPPQRHAATYRGSDRGRPAGRCTVRAHASYSCCRRPRLRARRGNRQTAQGLALARTQNHTHASIIHACMRARPRPAGSGPAGRPSAACRSQSSGLREQGRRRRAHVAKPPLPRDRSRQKKKKIIPARSWGHVKAYACAAGAARARWTERGTEGPKRPNPPRKTYERGRRRGRPCCWGRR